MGHDSLGKLGWWQPAATGAPKGNGNSWLQPDTSSFIGLVIRGSLNIFSYSLFESLFHLSKDCVYPKVGQVSLKLDDHRVLPSHWLPHGIINIILWTRDSQQVREKKWCLPTDRDKLDNYLSCLSNLDTSLTLSSHNKDIRGVNLSRAEEKHVLMVLMTFVEEE